MVQHECQIYLSCKTWCNMNVLNALHLAHEQTDGMMICNSPTQLENVSWVCRLQVSRNPAFAPAARFLQCHQNTRQKHQPPISKGMCMIFSWNYIKCLYLWNNHWHLHPPPYLDGVLGIVQHRLGATSVALCFPTGKYTRFFCKNQTWFCINSHRFCFCIAHL